MNSVNRFIISLYVNDSSFCYTRRYAWQKIMESFLPQNFIVAFIIVEKPASWITFLYGIW